MTGVGTVAVIGGTGDEGFGLGSRWAKAGVTVVIGSRDQGRAEEAAAKMRALVPDGDVTGMENAAATRVADVVAVTVPYGGQAAIYRSISDAVTPEKFVIDCTVPVAVAVGGKVTHTLGVWQGSAAQQAQSLLPKGTKLCAAFHSLAAVALNDLDHVMRGDVLAVGSKSGKEVVRELVEAIPDLRYVDGGPLENARIIEPITALLIGLNHRYDTDRTGISITGLPD